MLNRPAPQYSPRMESCGVAGKPRRKAKASFTSQACVWQLLSLAPRCTWPWGISDSTGQHRASGAKVSYLEAPSCLKGEQSWTGRGLQTRGTQTNATFSPSLFLTSFPPPSHLPPTSLLPPSLLSLHLTISIYPSSSKCFKPLFCTSHCGIHQTSIADKGFLPAPREERKESFLSPPSIPFFCLSPFLLSLPFSLLSFLCLSGPISLGQALCAHDRQNSSSDHLEGSSMPTTVDAPNRGGKDGVGSHATSVSHESSAQTPAPTSPSLTLGVIPAPPGETTSLLRDSRCLQNEDNATLWMLFLFHRKVVITENKSTLQNLKFLPLAGWGGRGC
nr:uncharacterized protein LOC132594100 [Globicephala melas]